MNRHTGLEDEGPIILLVLMPVFVVLDILWTIFSDISLVFDLLSFLFSLFSVRLMSIVHMRSFFQLNFSEISHGSSWLFDERHFILVVVRVPDENLIDVHDNHEGYTGDYHSQR